MSADLTYTEQRNIDLNKAFQGLDRALNWDYDLFSISRSAEGDGFVTFTLFKDKRFCGDSEAVKADVTFALDELLDENLNLAEITNDRFAAERARIETETRRTEEAQAIRERAQENAKKLKKVEAVLTKKAHFQEKFPDAAKYLAEQNLFVKARTT